MLLTKIWEKVPGKYFCISTRTQFKKWEDTFFKRSEFDQIPDFIKENMDKDVYWCPHGFSKPRRLKQYAEIPKILWADLDEVNPRDLNDLIPTVAWQSSPGRYAAIWFIDDYMTEELNQSLTNHIGADSGGWDLTQVLRVPGTKNYKYPDAPTVKTLWSDGDEYTTKEIQKQLPKPVEKKGDIDPTDARAIYKKYEKKFNTFIRKELLNGKPSPGRRSEVIWKLANEILEAGVSRDDCFELLRISPWNKFRGRRDGDKQLRREIDKATDKHINVSINKKETFTEEDDEDDKEDKKEWLSRSMADIEEINVEWIWEPYLAKGQVTILEGDPSVGKSYLSQIIAGYLVDAKPLPAHKRRRVRGRVAYFDAENSPGAVVKKRLVCNGIENLQDYIPEELTFRVNDEETFEEVNKALRKIKPILCVFDTINSYIDGDTNNAAEVTKMMDNFVEIARRHNCAVLLLRHLTKDKDRSALYRGQGSIAFAGAARIIITASKHPDHRTDDEHKLDRVLSMTKNNLAQLPLSLIYRIEGIKDTLNSTGRSKLTFGDWVDFTSDELVNVAPAVKDAKTKYEVKSKDIEDFLLDFLEGGPMTAGKVMTAAEARGFKNEKAVYRAADNLGIIRERAGQGKKHTVMWSLGPTKKKNPDLDDEDDKKS